MNIEIGVGCALRWSSEHRAEQQGVRTAQLEAELQRMKEEVRSSLRSCFRAIAGNLMVLVICAYAKASTAI